MNASTVDPSDLSGSTTPVPRSIHWASGQQILSEECDGFKFEIHEEDTTHTLLSGDGFPVSEGPWMKADQISDKVGPRSSDWGDTSQ